MAQMYDAQGNLVEVPGADPWGDLSAQIAAMNQMPSVDVTQTAQGPTISSNGVSAKALEQMQLQAIEDKRRNLLNRERLQRDAYQNAIASAQVDYTPLLNLVDVATGSQLAKGYKAPESVAAKQERLNAMEDRIQRGREAISDDRMNLLRAKLAQQSSLANSALQGKILSARLAALSPDAPPKLTGEAQGKVGALMSSLERVKELEDRIDAGEGPRLMTQETPIIGRALISDTEYDAIQRTLVDDIGRARSGGAINKDEEARFLAMLPGPADRKTPAVMHSKLQRLRSEFLTRLQGYKVSEENMGKLGFSPEKIRYTPKAPKKPPAGKAPPDFDSMTEEELQAYLSKGK